MAVKNIFPNTLGCNGMDASLPSVARCQKGPSTTSKTNYEMAKPPPLLKGQSTTVKTLATRSIILKTFSMAARGTT